MSLATALGQVLRDVTRGRKVIIVNISSSDGPLTITVLKSILHDTGLCNSIETTHSQCVARVKSGCFPGLAASVLQQYYKASPQAARSSGLPTLASYVQSSPERPESDCLSRLLSDPSASYILEVFNHVHSHDLNHPSAPTDCIHVVLSDDRGSYMGLLFAPSASDAPSTLADLQALKAAAAACMGSFRDANPGAAVVLAGLYHPTFKLSLLEDSQPEAITLIQSLQQAAQQGQARPPARDRAPWPPSTSALPKSHYGNGGGSSSSGCGIQGVQERVAAVGPVVAIAAVAAVAGAVMVRAISRSMHQPKPGNS
jgi:hypothetical protein